MADNFKVLDCRIDELQANLNAAAEQWSGLVWGFYDRGEERRISVVMVRTQGVPVQLPPGFDPRKLTRS